MLRQPVAVAVARGEVGQQRLDRRPGLADERVAVVARGDRIAPGLQDELRSEVLPVVDVLEVVAVRAVERVVVGAADVVRHRPADLAGRLCPDASIVTIAGSSTAIAASRSRMPRDSSSGKSRRTANDA